MFNGPTTACYAAPGCQFDLDEPLYLLTSYSKTTVSGGHLVHYLIFVPGTTSFAALLPCTIFTIRSLQTTAQVTNNCPHWHPPNRPTPNNCLPTLPIPNNRPYDPPNLPPNLFPSQPPYPPPTSSNNRLVNRFSNRLANSLPLASHPLCQPPCQPLWQPLCQLLCQSLLNCAANSLPAIHLAIHPAIHLLCPPLCRPPGVLYCPQNWPDLE
jgi:hypothetical protein